MSQIGAGFVIDKSQIFKMGTRTLGMRDWEKILPIPKNFHLQQN